MVYISAAYAPYFAIAAVKKKSDLLLLCEIETDRLDQSLLHPDEDFIAQAISHQRGCSIEDCHDEVRRELEGYQHHWQDSVEGLGNAAYKGTIPPSAITRFCTVDLSAQSNLLQACDPSISLMNYRFCGEQYRSVTAWLFGDREDFSLGLAWNESLIAMTEQHRPGYGDEVRAMFANRTGITVT